MSNAVRWAKSAFRRGRHLVVGDMERQVQKTAHLVAQLHVERVRRMEAKRPLQEAEFSVTSQAGEDGIIQYLVSHVPIAHPVFVEFGVENYREANTRFLLQHNNWSGLVIDGSPENIARIEEDIVSWQHELTARCAFVTRDNINALLTEAGVAGDIGLLSVDIDGNDYWVWEAITVVSPRIVVCEYNSVFGSRCAITVPYDAEFQRAQKHFSFLYFGASLPALCHLADAKGYVLAGSNSIGTNAFFVRKDVADAVPALSAQQGYVLSRSRESRDRQGRLSRVTGAARAELIGDMDVFDVDAQCLRKVRDCV